MLFLLLLSAIFSFITIRTEAFFINQCGLSHHHHHQSTNSRGGGTVLAAGRKRRPHRSRRNNSTLQTSFRRISSSTPADDILAYEKSLIAHRDGVSYILGSDETGRGAIAGPVVATTCCILPLKDYACNVDDDNNNNNDDDRDYNELLSLFVDSDNHDVRIKDSKQIPPDERERIYQTVAANPQMYAFSLAQRSNTEIDDTNNILTTTMECFAESIERLAQTQLIPLMQQQQQQQQQEGIADRGHDAQLETTMSSPFYSIVDGKKSPRLRMDIPCRPMVKADSQVVTVALASIIAKVTRDRMADEWHEQYPQYGFDRHKGYATRQHVEAIHRHGPCPLHRMTFNSLKGR